MKKKIFEVCYAEIWGLREEKGQWLEGHDVKNTKWRKLSPSDPYYFFVPREEVGLEEYQRFTGIQEIFPVSSTGIVTARDHFVVDQDRKSLESNIRTFLDKRNTDDYIKEFLRGILHRREASDVENYAWRVSQARQQLREEKDWEQYFTKILYRPFDQRWIYYHPAVVWRTRTEVMQHMLQPNLGLVIMRQVALDEDYTHFLATDTLIDNRLFFSAKGITLQIPLYLYTDTQTTEKKKNPGVTVMMLFDKPKEGYKVKRPNINLELNALLNDTYNPQPVTTPLKKQKAFDVPPEEIFYYIYAVLYSNTYRQKYQEFLKIDFLRVPFTKDYQLFQKLGKLGEQLVGLHLLKSKDLAKPIAKFQGKDSNMVEKREYEKGRVYINDEQYFEGIKPEVWEYQIGGYQVLDKWLKDRKGRALSSEDIKHYCKVVTALTKTIKLQEKIDKLYPNVERSLVGTRH